MVELDIIAEREEISESISRLHSSNGRMVFIDGIAYKITCPRFKQCYGPTYNNGFTKYLCSQGNHRECATENPEVCRHENYAKSGHPARHYPEQKRTLDYDPNLA